MTEHADSAARGGLSELEIQQAAEIIRLEMLLQARTDFIYRLKRWFDGLETNNAQKQVYRNMCEQYQKEIDKLCKVKI